MSGSVYKPFLRRSTSRLAVLFIGASLCVLSSVPALARNIIIFVADGLRYGSVNPEDAPTMYALRQEGTYFSNSHAVFPTFTTPNASAIATGHYLGDTGDFSNAIWTGFPACQAISTMKSGRSPARRLDLPTNLPVLTSIAMSASVSSITM